MNTREEMKFRWSESLIRQAEADRMLKALGMRAGRPEDMQPRFIDGSDAMYERALGAFEVACEEERCAWRALHPQAG